MAFIALQASAVFAQQLTIILHSVAEIRVDEEPSCVRKNKDLLISLEAKTFQAAGRSLLRFELLEIDSFKSYSVSYNEGPRQLLTEKIPHTLQTLNYGHQIHRYDLKIKNAERLSCDKALESIQLTSEPI